MPSFASRKYTQVVDLLEDQVGADISRDLLKVALAADDIDGLGVDLTDISGQPQSAVDVADKIDQIEDALSSVGSDSLLVDSNNALDVSAATVTITDDGSLVLDASSQGTLPVEQQSPVYVEADDDNGNTAQLQAEELGTAVGGTETALITKLAEALSSVANAQVRVDLQNNNAGLLESADQPLDVSDATVTITDDGSLVLDAGNQGTLPVEQQSPVGVEDSAGSQVDPLNQADTTPLTDASTAAGSGSAVSADLGDLRSAVDLFYDVAIDGKLQVEVSTDGATWRNLVTVDTNDSGTPQSDIVQIETAYQHVRFYADGNDFADGDVSQLELSAKGVN